MIIRPFQDSDILAIDEIWRKHHSNDFSVPNRSTRLVEWVAEEDGRVVAYGQVKLFAEAMIILDKDASQRAKIESLKGLLFEAFRGTNLAGLEDIYCFIRDPGFASILINHFGFELVDNPGELLLRKV
jgi:hypothetical protein